MDLRVLRCSTPALAEVTTHIAKDVRGGKLQDVTCMPPTKAKYQEQHATENVEKYMVQCTGVWTVTVRGESYQGVHLLFVREGG